MLPTSREGHGVTERWHGGSLAKDAYEAYAGAYDDFNHAYMYERWTGRLLAAARAVGLQGDRLLDVGCGTGLSLLPMVDRGWVATGCDISPSMLERAREKVGEAARLLVLDMRELPTVGSFDLVWAVNDAINYLLSMDELKAALEGMRRNLAPDGVILFDVNTLACYRSFFSERHEVDHGGRRFVWTGAMSAEAVSPGAICEASFMADDEPERAHIHRQRHFTEDEVHEAFNAVGLTALGVFGERDGNLLKGLDEDVHTKAVYVACQASYRDDSALPQVH